MLLLAYCLISLISKCRREHCLVDDAAIFTYLKWQNYCLGAPIIGNTKQYLKMRGSVLVRLVLQKTNES